MDGKVEFHEAQSRCEAIGGHVSFFLNQEELDQYNAGKEDHERNEWLGIKRKPTERDLGNHKWGIGRNLRLELQ